MKRSLVLFSVVAATIAGGCEVPTSKPPSRFIATFSPEDAMKRSYDAAEGKNQPTVSSTGASAGSGGLGITHRAISVEMSLPESDESQFLSKFKTEITEQLRRYGAKATGDGAGNKNYYLEYSEGAIAGVVEINGMRGAADNYRLVVLIAER